MTNLEQLRQLWGEERTVVATDPKVEGSVLLSAEVLGFDKWTIENCILVEETGELT